MSSRDDEESKRIRMVDGEANALNNGTPDQGRANGPVSEHPPKLPNQRLNRNLERWEV